jgi:hypothetical protein
MVFLYPAYVWTVRIARNNLYYGVSVVEYNTIPGLLTLRLGKCDNAKLA